MFASKLTMRMSRLLACSTLMLALMIVPVKFAAAPISDAYKLKAALIYKIAKFVTWPADSTVKDSNNFGICLLGEADFGEVLKSLEGRSVKGRTIVVNRFTQSRSIDARCQIVFISASKRAFMEDIVRYLQGKPILTVSDEEDFARIGGMVQFKEQNNKVGFNINLKSADRAGIKISSQLLNLATIVDR